MKRKMLLLTSLLVVVALLSGCLPGDGSATPADPAGFFWGIWHGWLAPVSLVLSIFKPSLALYEVHNTGFFYDLGFYMAVVSGFGGLSLARKKKD